MSEETKHCIALTKAGAPCKNYVMPASDYCRIHQPKTADASIASPTHAGATQTADAPPSPDPEELRELLDELNQLAAELRELTPDYAPPPFSRKKLRKLLKENLKKLAPEDRLQVLQDLQASFQGTTPRDFLYPETWQGLWYVLNHMIEEESGPMREKVAKRIASLPGGSFALDLRNSLQGTTPKDFLDIETWKGMWYVTTYMLENEKDELKRKIFGSEDEE